MDRISAVIIRNKKLLLVTGYDGSFYWTPGGKVDSKEKHEQTLIRELEEELSVNPTEISPYLTYEAVNEITKKKQKVHCYLIEYKGIPKPQKEITRILWYSKQNFKKRTPKISKGIEKYLIPKLIQDNLI